MNTTFSALSRTKSADLATLIVSAFGVLLRRVCRNVLAYVKAALEWLNSKHEFFNDADEDPIVCSGRRFVFYCSIAFACIVLLSFSIGF